MSNFKLFIVSAVLVCAAHAQSFIPLPPGGQHRIGQLRTGNAAALNRESVAQVIREKLGNHRSPFSVELENLHQPSTAHSNDIEDVPLIIDDDTNNFQPQHQAFDQQQQQHLLQNQKTQDELIAIEQLLRSAPATTVPVAAPVHSRNTIHRPVVHHQYTQRINALDTHAGRPTTAERITSEERNAEQAQNAHYTFDSSVQDTINDHAHTRTETRDGLSLTGMYSYSDGFFRRTVHYAADEGGYRVTKEEIEPIGDGPRFNPKGKADVSTSLTGSYTITADDFKRDPKQQTVQRSI